jgi:hypothetical protein
MRRTHVKTTFSGSMVALNRTVALCPAGVSRGLRGVVNPGVLKPIKALSTNVKNVKHVKNVTLLCTMCMYMCLCMCTCVCVCVYVRVCLYELSRQTCCSGSCKRRHAKRSVEEAQNVVQRQNRQRPYRRNSSGQVFPKAQRHAKALNSYGEVYRLAHQVASA